MLMSSSNKLFSILVFQSFQVVDLIKSNLRQWDEEKIRQHSLQKKRGIIDGFFIDGLKNRL